MAKRTAIIDIGSNSSRLVIYEKTSRFGFHLICEQKSKVRIGEGAYMQGGMLQPLAMQRAFNALDGFKKTIETYKAKKVVCVATSALRDAPNAKAFTSIVKKHLGISIKIIDGDTEAYLAAVAALNLLQIDEAITVDIGGGSADLALIKEGKIVQTYSLDLGTVRLKELFYDRLSEPKKAAKAASKQIVSLLESMPASFRSHRIVAIGGSLRALAKAIMKQQHYPLDKLHAFVYQVDDWVDYFDEIALCKPKALKHYGVKKSRFDTIREGTLIFRHIIDAVGAKEVITSSAGVREGVYLTHLLRHHNHIFPPDVNPSIVSLFDRFPPYLEKDRKKIAPKLASKLLEVLPAPKEITLYEKELRYALRLEGIGGHLTIYRSHLHASYIALEELNYRFSHHQTVLVALLLRSLGKSLIDEVFYERYRQLLPPLEVVKWLSFIATLAHTLYKSAYDAKYSFSYNRMVLTVTCDRSLVLAKEVIRKIQKPAPFAIVIDDREPKLPFT